MIRRVGLLAVLLGVLGGVIAASAIPRSRGPRDPQADSVVRRERPASPLTNEPGYVRLRATSRVVLAIRARDSRGGPDWAVRTYLAEQLVAQPDQRRRVSRVVGFGRCAQLGRVYRGRFGWLTADGTFRLVTTSDQLAAPTFCHSRPSESAGHPYADVVEPMTDPEKPQAQLLGSVVWGLAGASATTMTLQDGRRPEPLHRGANGTLLSVLGTDVRPRDLRLHVAYPDRPSVQVLQQRPEAVLALHHLPGQRASRTPLGPSVLSALAPDPDGGLPYALVTEHGKPHVWCTQAGARVAGGRYGTPNYRLDSFSEVNVSGGGSCGALPVPLREHDGRPYPPYALATTFGGSGSDSEGEDPANGRIARRLLRGKVIFSGVALPDVRSLTFATPSDVRTITPSGPAHGFIVVYAGDFPAGRVTVTTTYRDGHTRRDSMDPSL